MTTPGTTNITRMRAHDCFGPSFAVILGKMTQRGAASRRSKSPKRTGSDGMPCTVQPPASAAWKANAEAPMRAAEQNAASQTQDALESHERARRGELLADGDVLVAAGGVLRCDVREEMRASSLLISSHLFSF